jgi:hypothetical protein
MLRGKKENQIFFPLPKRVKLRLFARVLSSRRKKKDSANNSGAVLHCSRMALQRSGWRLLLPGPSKEVRWARERCRNHCRASHVSYMYWAYPTANQSSKTGDKKIIGDGLSKNS